MLYKMSKDNRDRLDRILKKVDYLKCLDKEYTVFGAQKHQYLFGKPLAEDVIIDFEKKYNVKLPWDYKLFMMEAGNGGAGPFYGIEPLEKCLFSDLDHPDEKYELDPSVPFPHRDAWNIDFDWDQEGDEDRENFETDYYDSKHITGAIRICNFGCAHFINLVVNGEEYSQVWSDDRGSDYGIYPFNYYKVKDKERLSFFDWYEAWFDQYIAEMESS